jgi:hypothetical protein
MREHCDEQCPRHKSDSCPPPPCRIARGGGIDIYLHQSKPLKDSTEGPLKVRRSLSGGRKPDHREVELKWLAEEEGSYQGTVNLAGAKMWVQLGQ